jgi:S1-C subfamily serine protease
MLWKPALVALTVVACAMTLRSAERSHTSKAGEIYQRAAASVVLVQTYGVFGNAQSFGTGFVVAEDGKILTNYHVIRNSKRAEVRLENGHTYDFVAVVDVDIARDIALLQIKATGLHALTLGNSGAVRIGDTVYSVSNPHGYNNTLSEGIISGIRLNGEQWRLQITAPISHGSSGGPLFNTEGEVIGITTEIDDKGQNLNFVVPIDYARGMLASSSQTTRSIASVYNPAEPASWTNFLWNAERRKAVVQFTVFFLTCWFLGRLVRKVWRMNNTPAKHRTLLGRAWFGFGLPVLLSAGIAVVMVLEFAVLVPQG